MVVAHQDVVNRFNERFILSLALSKQSILALLPVADETWGGLADFRNFFPLISIFWGQFLTKAPDFAKNIVGDAVPIPADPLQVRTWRNGEISFITDVSNDSPQLDYAFLGCSSAYAILIPSRLVIR